MHYFVHYFARDQYTLKGGVDELSDVFGSLFTFEGTFTFSNFTPEGARSQWQKLHNTLLALGPGMKKLASKHW